MPIVNSFQPSAQSIAGAAYTSGIGRAYRDTMARATERQTQVNENALQRTFQSQQREADRQFDVGRMQFSAQVDQENALAAEARQQAYLETQDRLLTEREKKRYDMEQAGYVQELNQKQKVQAATIQEHRRRLRAGEFAMPGVQEDGTLVPNSAAWKADVQLAAQEMGLKDSAEWIPKGPDPNEFLSRLADGPGGSKIDPQTGKQYMPPKMTKEQQDQSLSMDERKLAVDTAKVLADMKHSVMKDGVLTDVPVYTPEQILQHSGLGKFVSGTSSPSNIAQPQSAAEFSALPSGTQFLAPDGTMRIKP